MQFKHPELLYALFLLLIPIFIHLFQLRRFQKVDFTNVAFLKKVTVQTRKSSQLKKWITLLLRLLALACIVIAFAQPFTASKTALNVEKETVVYIDNSFSMEQKGPNGPMLQRALQQLFENVSDGQNIHWFTNNQENRNSTIENFKADVLSVPYSDRQLSPQKVLLKADQLFSNNETANKRLLYISDFQQRGSFPIVGNTIAIEAVQTRPVSTDNIAVDSVYVVSKNATNTQLEVLLSASGEVPETVPVSLYNENNLLAKAAVDFSENLEGKVQFDIENSASIKGRIEITDANLSYDNTLFFSINTPKKIKVLSINEANSNFLNRLFGQDEFEYSQQSSSSLNYNDFNEQNLIVLNELKSLPNSLVTALNAFVQNGGSLFVIPSGEAELSSYNSLFNSVGIGSLSEKISQEKQITNISFSHPLYRDVFEKEVVNFQYPKVNSFYGLNSNASAALQFEDGQPFIIQSGNVYASTAAFNQENSNFQSSPLIVPTLYNMALRSLPLSKLYYQINEQNAFAVPIQLVQDEILKIEDSISSFIPQQQTKANQVLITTNNQPERAGTFEIKKENTFLEFISFNYDRSESNLSYVNAEDWEGANVHESVFDLFEQITEENAINSFWKWFAIFALFFLLLEMLVLKFYKN